MLIAVTGGIGSGKSTVARLLEEQGFRRVDADACVKEDLLRRTDVIEAISEHFGSDALREDGSVDRGALAAVIFSNDKEREWLEALLHPLLFSSWRRLVEEGPRGNWIFEVPLLFEKHLENWFDFTLCVATNSRNQLIRLAERGMSQALAEQRISKQLPLAQKIEYADFVLSNDGTLPFLRAEVARWLEQLGVRN